MWLPSIITGSKHLGVLPEKLGNFEVVDWVPVDVLASIIIELVDNTISQGKGQTLVYNLVNPRSTTWSALAPEVQRLAGIERIAPMKDWMKALEQSSHERNGAIVETNPALKLLDFMRALSLKQAPAEVKSMDEVSGLVRDSKQAFELTEVSPEWMRLWMRQWKL